MRKRFFILFSVMILMLCAMTAYADKTEGDMYTFCPAISTLYYNSILKNFLDLNDSQAALVKVTSDGFKDGNLVYSDVLQNTYFIFGGVTGEYDTATTAYIYCSLKDSSTLKNVPMLLWASMIDMKYNGEIKETGSSFLEWVNEDKKDGETFSSPYFTALYSEEFKENCTLLLMKH